MTDEMMTLRGMVEKASDADLLRDMIAFAAERLIEMEVGALTGAAYGETSPERLAQRNGYPDRAWEVRRGGKRSGGPLSRRTAGARMLCATWRRCRAHFMRNALAHAGKSGRRVVSAFMATAFVRDTTPKPLVTSGAASPASSAPSSRSSQP